MHPILERQKKSSMTEQKGKGDYKKKERTFPKLKTCQMRETRKIIKLHILHVEKQNRTGDSLPNDTSTNSKVFLKYVRSSKSTGVSVQPIEDQGTSAF